MTSVSCEMVSILRPVGQQAPERLTSPGGAPSTKEETTALFEDILKYGSGELRGRQSASRL